MTAPVTGTSLVSLMPAASPARPGCRFTVAVPSGGTSTEPAPLGVYGPWKPSTCTSTVARLLFGLVTTSCRLPSPAGTPGMRTTLAGDVDGSCQSTPAGLI